MKHTVKIILRNFFVLYFRTILNVDFHPHSTLVASTSLDKSVKIWDLRAGSLIQTYELDSAIHHVQFHPDGNYLITGGSDSNIRVY